MRFLLFRPSAYLSVGEDRKRGPSSPRSAVLIRLGATVVGSSTVFVLDIDEAGSSGGGGGRPPGGGGTRGGGGSRQPPEPALSRQPVQARML